MDYPSEQEYAEAFGVETEETTEETGGAEKSPETPAEGAQTPPEETENGAEDSEDTPRALREDEDGEVPPMPVEERRRQAAMRREREREAARRSEQQRVDSVYERVFRGRVNPFTQQPIRTEQDYLDYERAREDRDRAEELERAGLSEDTLRSAVRREVEPLRRELMENKLAGMRERAKAVNAAAEQEISRALGNIAAVDPSIRSLEDIAKLPTAARFQELVSKGVGIEDAFFLANRKAMTEQTAKAAYAKGTRAGASRAHLAPLAAPDAPGQVNVPREFAENYRAFLPDATDREIREAFAEEAKLKN